MAEYCENSSDDAKITILIKTQERNEEFLVDRALSVADLKPLVAERFNAEINQLCLIYAGRLLNDTDTLRDRNVKNGFAIHLVIRSNARMQQRQQSQMEVPREAQIEPGSGGSSSQSQQRINAIATSLLANPTYLRAIISMDPRLQAYLEQNPEVAHAINNPHIMREYLEIAANPNMMQEFLRNQDLTMRNLESMPGGFAAMESIYNNLQELDNANNNNINESVFAPQNETNQAGSNGANPPQLNANPLPNPWSNEASARSAGQLGGASFVPTPEAVNQLLEDPTVQQLMRDLVADPNLLDSVVNSAPPVVHDANVNEYLRSNLPNVLENLSLGGAEGLHDFMAQLQNQQGQQEIQPPETRYSGQLNQLHNMGFTDRSANLRALVRTFGEINGAIDILTRNE